MIGIIEKSITPEEYNYLTAKVGWGVREESIVKEALQNTVYSVCAFDGERIVGFARLIGDKTIFLYLQDVMVLPDYQGQGIGTMLLEKIVAKIHEVKKISPTLRVYLGASKGCEGFYKRFGFITRSEADLGEGMLIFNK